jgi:hypothetical protein
MSVPLELIGAWRRSGLLLDGVRQVDYCDVIWLQTPDWYADIRLRINSKGDVPTEGVPPWFSKEFSFAGIATWSDPVITWDHALDFYLEPAIDSNPLSWGDGVACENGKTMLNGVEVPFTEEWLRMTDDDVQYSAVIRDEQHVRIEVGRFAIEITDERPSGRFSATRYQRATPGGDWTEFGRVTA